MQRLCSTTQNSIIRDSTRVRCVDRIDRVFPSSFFSMSWIDWVKIRCISFLLAATTGKGHTLWMKLQTTLGDVKSDARKKPRSLSAIWFLAQSKRERGFYGNDWRARQRRNWREGLVRNAWEWWSDHCCVGSESTLDDKVDPLSCPDARR